MFQLQNKKISTPVGVIIILLAVILVSAVSAWQYQLTLKEKVKTSARVVIDQTANWQTYRNEKYGFEMKYPQDWALAIQNDEPRFLDILFYDKKFKLEIDKSENPLLAILDKDVDFIRLNVNSNDFIKKADFNLQNYVILGAGGPGGRVYEEKLLNWEAGKTIAGDTIYFYKKEIQAEPIVKRQGVVWVSNDTLFEIMADSKKQDEFLRQMAESWK